MTYQEVERRWDSFLQRLSSSGWAHIEGYRRGHRPAFFAIFTNGRDVLYFILEDKPAHVMVSVYQLRDYRLVWLELVKI